METKSRKTDPFKRILSRGQRKPRGQSFVELMLVVMFLAILMAGVVEFGFLLNQYLHVLDGAREAARYSSTSLAFILNGDGSIATDSYGANIDNLAFYYISAAKAATTMDPVVLNPANPDDIVISVLSVTSGHLPVRFPSSNPNGWSLCAHYAAFAAYFPSLTPPATVPAQLSDPGWKSGCTVRTSQFSGADIQSRMDPSALNTGVLLVEIYYNYPQLLKLLSNNGFMGVTYSLLPDPVPLYVYTVMPLSSAEPTTTPPPH
jgi:Flp pilus assembly protein TadG